MHSGRAPVPWREPRNGRPILVTGGHRSGTGWVGQILSTSSQPVGYVWEPFSLRHRLGTLNVRWPYWFPYVTSENGAAYRDPIALTLAWRYAAMAETRSIRSAKDIGRMARDWWQFKRFQREQAIPLFKDPIAVFSAEWLVDEFGMRVVLLVRHPAAFISSLKRLRWTHPFDHFTAQPLLMSRLSTYADDLEEYARREADIVDQGILLWNVIHHVIAEYSDRYPDWILARQEDLARRPHPGFAEIFRRLDLPKGSATDGMIDATTSGSNPVEGSLSSIHRDSATHATSWKRGLEPREIIRIREGTEGVAARFYSPEDW
jgi:Sulfotransferase family